MADSRGYCNGHVSGAPRVASVQIGRARPWAGKHPTGITKAEAPFIEVADPGPRGTSGRSGVSGDFIGDGKHHGGTEQAVYLVAREQLDFWERQLDRSLPNGAFGENITTIGVDVDRLLIGARLQIGTAVLEVTAPRIPCRTFAWAMDVPGWVKRFTEHGHPGAYTSVLTPGRISPDDAIEVLAPDVFAPNTGQTSLVTGGSSITIRDVFGAYTGDRDALERTLAAHVVPARYQRELERRLRS